jgi:hypothetical protein
LKEKSNENVKKFNDREKYSRLLIDKLKLINDEKNKIILEESEARNKIVQETEKFVKDIQDNYEKELPEKNQLIEENQTLRREIEKCVQATVASKDEIENKLKEKEKKAMEMESSYKNDIRFKMEEMSLRAQKYLIENSELKTQIVGVTSKNIEMENADTKFNAEYEKLQNELEKKKENILLLSKENFELQIKIKNNFNRDNLEKAYKEAEKLNNQSNSMKNLNKKLNEQYNKVVAESNTKSETEITESEGTKPE